MPTPIRRLDGIIPILSMPFREDDEIDLESLVAQAEWLAVTGVDGVGFGFGSEIYRLTDAERDLAIATVVRVLAGRLPIVAAASANSTRATLLRSEAARDAGASVLMITPPAFASPTPDDLVTHYAAIADRVGLPIIVQDAPSMTNVTMTDDLLVRLAQEIDLVVAVKIEALPPAPKVGAVVAKIGDAASVLGGAGGIDFAHELGRGAHGTIPGAATPELFVAVYRHARAGNLPAARALFNRYLPLLSLSARTMDTFLFTQREILRRRGILPSTHMRHPSEHLDPFFPTELEQMLCDLDLANLGRTWNPS
jgi:4-hydroxy-tetrahydrodipicolinate synthase